MADVVPFVPWHVAARDSIAEWIPAAGRSRKVALIVGSAMAVVLTILTAVLATQADLLAFAANVAIDRTREVLVAGVGSVVVNLFGEQTFNAVAQYGAFGFALAGGTMLLAVGGTFASLRALAASANRRRG
jgi:hypothetical protein